MSLYLPLTVKEQEMLDYVTKCVKEDRRFPTYSAIAAHFGFSSNATVMHRLRALAMKGRLRPPRCWEIVEVKTTGESGKDG